MQTFCHWAKKKPKKHQNGDMEYYKFICKIQVTSLSSDFGLLIVLHKDSVSLSLSLRFHLHYLSFLWYFQKFLLHCCYRNILRMLWIKKKITDILQDLNNICYESKRILQKLHKIRTSYTMNQEENYYFTRSEQHRKLTDEQHHLSSTKIF